MSTRKIIRFMSAAVFLCTAMACAQNNGVAGKFSYRGYVIDVSAALSAANLPAIESSVKHQIDIAADCGAKPEVLTFFRAQEIVLKAGASDGGGHFSPSGREVTIDAVVQEPQKPIVLHELLHAYHFRMLPGQFQNPDILRFYNNAKQAHLYPADAYVLKNPQEFFAVTASLYLWGNVDRPPFNRTNLKTQQPVYYAWLGQLFGVQK